MTTLLLALFAAIAAGLAAWRIVVARRRPTNTPPVADKAATPAPEAAKPTRTPEEVGQLVISAIREGRFLLPTDPIILDLYREHAASPEGFVDRIIETVRG